jgi:hypothetical protein
MLTSKKQPPLPPPSDTPDKIRPIEEDPHYAEALAALQGLEERLRQTGARREHANARNRGGKSIRSSLDRAKDLVAGGRVRPVNAASELEACDREEFDILRPAIATQAAVLNDIRSELSLAACNRLRPEYEAAMVALLRAIEDGWAAIAAATNIGNRLRALGYTPRADILPALYPAALVTLGDPDNSGRSQAALFKEALRKHRII